MSVILLPPASLSPRRCTLTSRQSFFASPTHICLGLHTSLSTFSFSFEAFVATAVRCIQSTFSFPYPLPCGCCGRISFRCCSILIPQTPRTVRPGDLTPYSGSSNRTECALVMGGCGTVVGLGETRQTLEHEFCGACGQ